MIVVIVVIVIVIVNLFKKEIIKCLSKKYKKIKKIDLAVKAFEIESVVLYKKET